VPWKKGETVDVNALRRAGVFEWSVGIAGVAAGLAMVPALAHQNLWIVLMLCLLAALIEAVPVPLGKVKGSLLISFPAGIVLVFGTPVAVWVMIVAALCNPWLASTQMRPSTVIFNAGQYALSTCACGLVIRALPWSSTTGTLTWWTLLTGALGSAVFLLLNHGFVQALQWARAQLDPKDAWRVFCLDVINLVIAMPFTALFVTIAPSHPVIAVFVMLPTVLMGLMVRNYRHLAYLQQAHLTTAQLMSEFDVDRISEVVAKTAAGMTYADAVAVYVLNAERDRLLPSFIYPLDASSRFDLSGIDRADGGLIWHVLFGDGTVYVPDAVRDRRVRPEERAGYRSLAVFPMRTLHDVHGVIVCYSDRPYAFGDMQEYVRTLARQVGVLFENAKLYQELQDLSLRDGVTGLYNYRFFYEALDGRLQEAAATGGRLSVAVVDVDWFKKFNDTYGHLAGDAVLRSVGRLLAQMSGPDAVVARYGGEEFALILPMPGPAALELVERIRRMVAEHVVEYDGYQLRGITVSSGIASFPEHGRDGRELLLKADSAMYWGAKQRGRNRTVLYTPEFEADLFVDSQTGLYTLHFLNLRVREDFARGTRNWGVVALGISALSGLEDTLGASVRDQVAREVGVIVKECLRQTDVACRYDADIVVVAVPGGSRDELRVIGERVARAIATHGFRAGDAVAVRLQPRFVDAAFAGVSDPDDVIQGIHEVVRSLRQAGESLA
jgi:diguanylate cyclase (GGDEF)-like protein